MAKSKRHRKRQKKHLTRKLASKSKSSSFHSARSGSSKIAKTHSSKSKSKSKSKSSTHSLSMLDVYAPDSQYTPFSIPSAKSSSASSVSPVSSVSSASSKFSSARSKARVPVPLKEIELDIQLRKLVSKTEFHNYMQTVEKRLMREMADLITKDNLHNYMSAVEKNILKKMDDGNQCEKIKKGCLSKEKFKKMLDKFEKELIRKIPDASVGRFENLLKAQKKEENVGVGVADKATSSSSSLSKFHTPVSSSPKKCGRGKRCPHGMKCQNKKCVAK